MAPAEACRLPALLLEVLVGALVVTRIAVALPEPDPEVVVEVPLRTQRSANVTILGYCVPKLTSEKCSWQVRSLPC